ncbi:MAG: hypothetical protein ACREKE_08845 [bacterium]
MKRKTLVLLGFPLALVLVSTLWGLKIHMDLHRGPVFWLAELWPPAAVLTIVAVVCVDYATAIPKKLKTSKTKGKAKRGKPISRLAR